jgi:hypothetical protein
VQIQILRCVVDQAGGQFDRGEDAAFLGVKIGTDVGRTRVRVGGNVLAQPLDPADEGCSVDPVFPLEAATEIAARLYPGGRACGRQPALLVEYDSSRCGSAEGGLECGRPGVVIALPNALSKS